MVGSVYSLFIIGMAFLCNILLFLSPLFFSTVWLYLAVFKITIDYFFLYPVHKILGTEKNLKYFILFEAYFIIYIVTLPILLLLNKKITWKGRTY